VINMNHAADAAERRLTRRKLLTASSTLGVSAVASGAFADDATPAATSPLLTVRPRSESVRPWMMPAHFGMPHWQRTEGVPSGDSLYDDVTRISISYLTDEERLTSYLPRPYELDGPPVVTVTYSMNRDISWLAGRDYNIISVSAPAVYRGERDVVSGNYALVLWEDLTAPILSGREMQGIPKIYGQIEDHRVFRGTWSTALSNNGLTILELEAAGLAELPADGFATYQAAIADANLLGWKYIPGEPAGLPAGPALSYATQFPITCRCREAWTATGRLAWRPRTWQELPTQAHIVNALHALPVGEIVSCIVSNVSITLHSSKVKRLV
jgi:acetoacetate decarboxylase